LSEKEKKKKGKIASRKIFKKRYKIWKKIDKSKRKLLVSKASYNIGNKIVEKILDSC